MTSGLAVALVAFALTLAFVTGTAQSSLARRTPWLRLQMPLFGTVAAFGYWSLLFAGFGMVTAAYAPGAVGGPLAGFVTVLGLSTWFALRKAALLDLLAVRRLERLVTAKDASGAKALATQIVQGEARRDPATHAGWVLATAELVGRIDLEAAERLADTLSGNAALTPRMRWYAAHSIAVYRVALGRYDAATAALAGVTGDPPTAELAEMRELLLARVEAATGRAEEALARIGERPGPTWDGARAHALAALGRADEARDLLERLADEQGRAVLEEIVLRKGPAATIASALLARDEKPYR